MTLAAYSRARRLGSIRLAAGKLTGSSSGLQDVADAAVRRAGGDPAKAYAALDGYCNGYLTIITAPAEQDAARAQRPPESGTPAAAAEWREELHHRGWHGRFGHGTGPVLRKGDKTPIPARRGPAETGPALRGQPPRTAGALLEAIDAEIASADADHRAGVGDSLRIAREAAQGAKSGTSWRTIVNEYLLHAGGRALALGDKDRSARLETLAHQALYLPDEGPADAAVRDLAGTAMPAAARVLGGGDQKWDGRVTIFSEADNPGVLGTMGWHGRLSLQDSVAGEITDTAVQPGRQIVNPDAYMVIGHEAIHGVEGGLTPAGRKAWQALTGPQRLTIGDIADLDRQSPAGGAWAVARPLPELKHSLGYIDQPLIDELAARGLLEKTSTRWAGDGWRLTAKARRLIPGRQTAKDHENAYAYETGVKALEEGGTELAATQHAEELFRAEGVAGRATALTAGDAAGNPEYVKRRDALLKALDDAAAVRPAAAFDKGIADALLYAKLNLRRHNDPAGVAGVLDVLRHSPATTPALAARADGISARLDDLLTAPTADRHLTMAEYARRMADPARIRDGQSWGHYPDWTAQMQNWVQQVARGEGQAGTGKPGTAGYQRTVELSDEINREGPAGKAAAMARQLVRAMGDDPDTADPLLLADLASEIRQRWGMTTYSAVRRAALRRGIGQHPERKTAAVRAAAARRGSLLSPAGAKARAIAEWAWQDPKGRAAGALAQVNQLARDTADMYERRQVQDAGQMLARLTGTPG